MGAKTRVVVRHYPNPVRHVVVDETEAANLHFGEMTAAHARRDRRRRRSRERHDRNFSTPSRLW